MHNRIIRASSTILTHSGSYLRALKNLVRPAGNMATSYLTNYVTTPKNLNINEDGQTLEQTLTLAEHYLEKHRIAEEEFGLQAVCKICTTKCANQRRETKAS